MNIDNMTYGELKQIAALFNGQQQQHADGLNSQIGKKVIIRTYSAGVWFGVLREKAGKEVIITDARRMWQWHAAESISLSGVALYGITHSKSKIAPPVEEVWLEAIEIIPVTDESAISIGSAAHAEPQ